jgi:O-antigen/teichoic acid export membrane protein
VNDKGVWALIGAQLAAAASRALLLWIMVYPLVSFEGFLIWTDLKSAVRFGSYQMGERLLNYAGWNIDKLVVGRMLGDGALGVYSIAYQLVIRPFSILSPVFSRVTLPLFSRIQNDDERLCRGYLQTVRTIALISFPIYIFLILAAHSIVNLLLGPKWFAAASLLGILGGLGFVYSLGNPIGSLLLAKGRVDLGFFYNLIAVFVYATAIYFCSTYGLRSVALGVLLAAGCILFPIEFLLRWLIVRMSPGTYWAAIRNICFASFLPLLVAKVCLISIGDHSKMFGVDLIFGIIAVLACYSILWFTERELLQQTYRLIRQR